MYIADIISRCQRRQSYWLGLILPLLLAACTETPPPDRGLYEWRSSADVGADDLPILDSLGISRLYVRLFDVQVDPATGESTPASVVQYDTPLPHDLAVIPTIYITLATIRALDDGAAIDTLADRILRKVRSTMPVTGHTDFDELQIDCDWTASTQTTYFRLLECLRSQLPEATVLSATIRLHQIKFRRQSGVPPVDRGLLMVYNTGEVTALDESNAIIRADVVDDYISTLDEYPLPLDVALPIFSWGVRFHFDRFAEILPDLDSASIAASGLARNIAANRWLVERSGYLRGVPVTASDLIRVEEAHPRDVLPVAEAIADRLDDTPRSVVLYRYDPQYFDRYAPTDLDPLYRAFE